MHASSAFLALVQKSRAMGPGRLGTTSGIGFRGNGRQLTQEAKRTGAQHSDQVSIVPFPPRPGVYGLRS
jgi:hypothetical protein